MAIKSKIVGMNAVQMDISRWVKKRSEDALKTARGLAALKLATLIRSSPQYTGDFAANWNYSLNVVDRSHDEYQVVQKSDNKPYQQFDRPAINLGLAKNRGNDNGMKLGDTVYISNFSTHTDHIGPDEYYKKILKGTLLLRDVNLNITLRAAIQMYNDKYAKRLQSYQLGYVKGRRAGMT